MQGARAPALASTGTSGNPGLLDGRATHGSAGEAPGNGATVLHRLFLCFSFFRRVTGTRCSCRRGAGPSPVGGRGRAGAGRTPTAHASGPKGGGTGCAAPTAAAQGGAPALPRTR